MLCILAFVIFIILFPILGFFPEYRYLFRRSWQCVVKKATLKPCDINLGQELKSKLLGGLVFKYPKIAKFLNRTFTFWALLFVVINVWSITAVASSGLNLWVYDTCDPVSGEGCSLSGEACGVSSDQISFNSALENNKLGEWAVQPVTLLGKTLSRVPDRLKTWNATDYLSPTATYYLPFDSGKPTAIEFIDPGCKYCKKLFHNIKEAGFEKTHNLTYVVYPIPDSSNTINEGYKFQASKLIASYMEATKKVPLTNNSKQIPADWQLLEYIFMAEDNGLGDLQNEFNLVMSKKDIPIRIEEILAKLGYSNQEIEQIRNIANSEEVKQNLKTQKDIVENQVKTIKIPTIIFNGRRFDRLVDVETLRKG